MDIENLKLIISTLNELGANTKEVFIWWFLVTYGIKLLFGLIWSGIALFCLNRIYLLISQCSKLEHLMEAAGVYNYFTSQELKKACEVLRNHYK